ATSLLPVLVSRPVDQDPAHRLGRRGEEMAAAVPPRGLLGAKEPQVGLVNQGGGLKRLPRLLVHELVRSQPPELVIDDREERVGCFGVALFDGCEDAGDVVHFANVYTRPSTSQRTPKHQTGRKNKLPPRCGTSQWPSVFVKR